MWKIRTFSHQPGLELMTTRMIDEVLTNWTTDQYVAVPYPIYWRRKWSISSITYSKNVGSVEDNSVNSRKLLNQHKCEGDDKSILCRLFTECFRHCHLFGIPLLIRRLKNRCKQLKKSTLIYFVEWERPGCPSGYDAGLTNQTSLVWFPSPLNFS